MFDRYSDNAMSAINLAREQAMKLGHRIIGTELLLLGLSLEPSTASDALDAAGLTSERLQSEVEKIIGLREPLRAIKFDFTPDCDGILKLAATKATELGDRRITADHLLLALLDRDAGFGTLVLARLSIDSASLYQNVLLRNMKAKEDAGKAGAWALRRGDVVLAALDYTNKDEGVGEEQPVVVISDGTRRRQRFVVVPLIHFNEGKTLVEPLDVLIRANTAAGSSSGLRLDALVRCTRVSSLSRERLMNRLGSLPEGVIKKIIKNVTDIGRKKR